MALHLAASTLAYLGSRWISLLQGGAITDDILGSVVRQRKAMQTEAYCLMHEKACCYKKALIHIAGTECRAHSTQGPRSGDSHESYSGFAAWAGQRLEIQEQVIVDENVSEFMDAIPLRFFDELYVLNFTHVDMMPLLNVYYDGVALWV